MSFSSNPIVIRSNGDMLGIIDLDFDPDLRSFILEIKNQNEEVLFHDKMEEDTFLYM